MAAVALARTADRCKNHDLLASLVFLHITASFDDVVYAVSLI
jgi:hypothetical protein